MCPRLRLLFVPIYKHRFHQIRRHLNGISHPVVGDSVHGSSSFNRELVGHPNNPAPAGRLLLHCLRLELPTLPDAGSNSWKTGSEEATADDEQQLEEDRRRRGGDGSDNARRVSEDNGEAHPQGSDGGGDGGSSFSGSFDSSTPPSEPDKEDSRNNDRGRGGVTSGAVSPGLLHPARATVPSAVVTQTAGGATLSPSIAGANKAIGEGGRSDEAGGAEVEGMEVYAEPPDDMLAFLRGMSWWEEGMIQAAERGGQRISSPRRRKQ